MTPESLSAPEPAACADCGDPARFRCNQCDALVCGECEDEHAEVCA